MILTPQRRRVDFREPGRVAIRSIVHDPRAGIVPVCIVHRVGWDDRARGCWMNAMILERTWRWNETMGRPARKRRTPSGRRPRSRPGARPCLKVGSWRSRPGTRTFPARGSGYGSGYETLASDPGRRSAKDLRSLFHHQEEGERARAGHLVFHHLEPWRRHRGDVRRPDQGLTFVVTLPACTSGNGPVASVQAAPECPRGRLASS